MIAGRAYTVRSAFLHSGVTPQVWQAKISPILISSTAMLWLSTDTRMFPWTSRVGDERASVKSCRAGTCRHGTLAESTRLC